MDFIEDLPDGDVQPVETFLNKDYLVIRQWDGTGEMKHVVCIPKTSIVLGEIAALIHKIKPT